MIDCDVHANVPELSALFPYLDQVWIDWARERQYGGPAHLATVYPPNAPTTVRPEWKVEGRKPASTLSMLQEHVLDPWDVDYAVLTCYYGIDALRHPDWAAALAGAINDWMIDKWFVDKRLVGSLVVPARHPAAMIREIERVGDHPQFRQVLFPVRNDRLWGDRIYHPVYEAMAKKDLVLGLHWGGSTQGPPSPIGYASWFVEEYAAEWSNFGAQVTDLVIEGVFKQIPGLRVAVLEGGFTWLPGWGWRLDKEWKGLHREVPWLDSRPLEVIKEHFRFSIAPADAGPPEHMRGVIERLGAENLLMFATDYPHHHDTDVPSLLGVMPETMRSLVMSESAREWYRLPG